MQGSSTVALDPHTASLLREQVAGKQPENYVFSHPNTGSFWNETTWVTQRWGPTLARAVEMGLTTRPRLHDLRHTHASWLLTDGVGLLVVSRRLGHESIKVTADTYGHIQPEADDAVRAVLSTRRGPRAAPALRTVS